MHRIKIPELIINLIINVFDRRQIKVITAVGLSDGFTANDGIDQGEVISPLLWRIFYDPLLCKIQTHNNDWGYNMDLIGVNYDKYDRSFTDNATINSACSAFADDTIWIGNSRNNLQNIIDLSDSFYQLNDMEINGDKSELLYIGPKKDKEDTSITMGNKRAIIYPPANKTPRVSFIFIRFDDD